MNQILMTLEEIVMAHVLLVMAIALLVLAATLIAWRWRDLAFARNEMDYRFPLFGRISRIMRDKNLSPDDEGWFSPERQVCADHQTFFNFHAMQTREFYEKCALYLSKVTEQDRRNRPWYIGLIFFVMVVAEAYGFAYVLSLWGFVQAAMNTLPFLASGLALLLAIAAIILTDQAGRELYLNTTAKRVRRDFSNRDFGSGLHQRTTLQPTRAGLLLDGDQHIDDSDPPVLQTVNRLTPRAREVGYTKFIIAIIYIVIIAVGSTVIRVQAFEKDEIAQQQISQAAPDLGSVKVGNFPKDLTDEHQRAVDKANNDNHAVDVTGAWTTFIVMAVIFIAIQIVGMMIGFRYGFAGSESEKAWKFTHVFNNGEEFEAYHANRRDEIANLAQSRLATIQGKILKAVQRNPTGDHQVHSATNAGPRTFMAYVTSVRNRTSYRPQQQTHAPQPAPSYGQPQPGYVPGPAPGYAPPAYPQPQPGYGHAPPPGYAQPSYPQPQPGYGHAPPPGYAQPSYPQPQPGYAPAPPPGYAQPSYPQPQPGYGRPQPTPSVDQSPIPLDPEKRKA